MNIMPESARHVTDSRASDTRHGAIPLPEEAVYQRYAAAAQAKEASLCCAVSYDRRLLEVIPREILERDYGCGDPTSHLRPGETVLDLGSGGGKLCYIAAQVVGPAGRVIGVDCNQEMLSLARMYREEVAGKLGFANVEFRCGLIQDLQLDLDLLVQELKEQPVCDQHGWLRLRQLEERLRQQSPLVADASVDCVISNCVLNLVRQQDRRQLFDEVFRVLKPTGRAIISDIIASQDVPLHLRQNAELWSGCISGAFREDRFLKAFADAGFQETQVLQRQQEPWRVVAGIEFRSVTVAGYKDKGRLELVGVRNQDSCCGSTPCC
jgi:ubiquinone/menaquinone biosynthesis C-methylase UbiE